MKRPVGVDEELVAAIDRAIGDGNVGAARGDELPHFRMSIRLSLNFEKHRK